jgi:non-homologous end joining protein Ku
MRPFSTTVEASRRLDVGVPEAHESGHSVGKRPDNVIDLMEALKRSLARRP